MNENAETRQSQNVSMVSGALALTKEPSLWGKSNTN